MLYHKTTAHRTLMGSQAPPVAKCRDVWSDACVLGPAGWDGAGCVQGSGGRAVGGYTYRQQGSNGCSTEMKQAAGH